MHVNTASDETGSQIQISVLHQKLFQKTFCWDLPCKFCFVQFSEKQFSFISPDGLYPVYSLSTVLYTPLNINAFLLNVHVK